MAATLCQVPPRSSTAAFRRAVFASAWGVQLYTVSCTLHSHEAASMWVNYGHEIQEHGMTAA